MRAKDKKRKGAKVSLKNIISFLAFIIIVLYGVIFYNYYITKNEVYAQETNAKVDNTNDVTISNASLINIDEIIENNTKNQNQEEYITEETVLEYITEYKSNSELPKGAIQVIQEGREGTQSITKKVVYENGEITNEEQISSKITKAAVNKIVEVGTSNYKSSYKVKVGDTVYVTSDRASIMLEADENSEKLATLTKGNELKVLEVKDNWYKIQGSGATGYIKIENTTYINGNEEEVQNQESTSNQNIQKPSFGMALNKPSGLSLEQFKKVLTDSKDKNKIFEKNSEYFYYIEKQYNINGLFVAAVGIHESAWGTSKIALQKHNLFGYGAYDSNPYNGAYQFTDYSECIDLIARVFVKYYLNPKGTSIYDNEKAQGTYYNGPTLSGVNTRYATDKNWANGVYNHMKYLYNKL